MAAQQSISPEGESFSLPSPEDYALEFERLETLAAQQRAVGREVVVVVGVGFVGAVMAAVVADAEDAEGSRAGGVRARPRGDACATGRASAAVPCRAR